MKNLLTGIMTKTSGSAFSTDVGGRIYFEQAPDGATFPYCVFSIVSGNPEDTFTEKVTDVVIQFSLYSTSPGVTEIGTMYDDLQSLFNDAVFSVTSNTLLRCMFQSFTTISEDATTLAGGRGLRHWAVDYLMTTEAN